MKKSMLFKSIFAGTLALSTFSAQAVVVRRVLFGAYTVTAATGIYRGTKAPQSAQSPNSRASLALDAGINATVAGACYALGNFFGKTVQMAARIIDITPPGKNIAAITLLGLKPCYDSAYNLGKLGASYAKKDSKETK